MSQRLAEQVNLLHPELLKTNINATCYQFVVHLLAALRGAGHSAYHISKTAGEGQYTPPGFRVHTFVGFDGKGYTCTGVSHDAIWCDGVQFDTIGSGNDDARPIYKANTPEGWSFDPTTGPRIVGTPVWNPIPKEYWRPNNPPMLIDDILPSPIPAPTPPPPALPPYPFPEDAVDGAGVALFADFAQAGQAPNPQMFRFAFRSAYSWLSKEVPSLEASVAKHRREWRQILGLPPL